MDYDKPVIVGQPLPNKDGVVLEPLKEEFENYVSDMKRYLKSQPTTEDKEKVRIAPVSGYEVYGSDEFKAFCKKFGINWGAQTKELVIVLTEDSMEVYQSYKATVSKPVIDTTNLHNKDFVTKMPNPARYGEVVKLILETGILPEWTFDLKGRMVDEYVIKEGDHYKVMWVRSGCIGKMTIERVVSVDDRNRLMFESVPAPIIHTVIKSKNEYVLRAARILLGTAWDAYYTENPNH